MLKFKISLLLLVVISFVMSIPTYAQTSSFNFSLAPRPVSGWINVYGNPASASISVNDPATGFSISNIQPQNWSGGAADDNGADGGTFFPSGVMKNHWFQFDKYYAAYNAALPQLEISGLKKDSLYTIKMTGSFIYNVPSVFDLNPMRYTVSGAVLYGYADVNGNFNTSDGAVFHNIAPDINGKIRVYVNTYGGSNTSSINGLQIITGRTTAPMPVVTFLHPQNNDVIPEDGNVSISVQASVAGGSISRVQFYVDTVLLGTDSVAPYNILWVAPDAGKYTLRARAIDGMNNVSTAAIDVSVESLSSFWSMTGNIAANADSNFLGTVDTNRLAFRTNNIERVSILSSGYVGVGTKSPTAQFHTTGTVRFSGILNDSTKARVLVTDTAGNIFYRTASTIGSGAGWTLNGNAGINPNTSFIGTIDAQPLVFKTNNSQSMTILANGAVGIGGAIQPAADAKLFVKGIAYAQRIRVTQQGWADYVFKKDYLLPSLYEVESFVKTHQHLPGVPSEIEVKKNGLDLGSSQKILLEKIEELTLYLIAQKKELDAALQANMNLLKANDEAVKRSADLEKRLKQQQDRIEAIEKTLLKISTDKPETN